MTVFVDRPKALEACEAEAKGRAYGPGWLGELS
jgi:hypothetical protein